MSTISPESASSNGNSEAAAALLPGALRPLSAQDFANNLDDRMSLAVDRIESVREALGSDPVDILRRSSEIEIAGLRGTLASVADDIARIIEVMGFVQETRVMVDLTIGHETNGFHGEAHLEEIRMNVVLTLDPNTGNVVKIDVLRPGVQKNPAALGTNQIQATISGSEFAKEIMAANWNNDPAVMRQHDAWIESELKRNGRVDKGGKMKKITKITPGQIPASRAWVNPGMALRPIWERSSRSTLAGQRKEMIDGIGQSADVSVAGTES